MNNAFVRGITATILGLYAATATAQSPPAAPGPSPSALFVFAQTDPKGVERFFVFRLEDSARIQEARAILARPSVLKRPVQGTVIQKPAPYNPQWSFHLMPSSIGFFEMQVEVCDANVTYVQDHLAEVGGSFLPKSFWCPWSSRLIREIP